MGDHGCLKTELFERTLLQPKHPNTEDIWHDPSINNTDSDYDHGDAGMRTMAVDMNTECVNDNKLMYEQANVKGKVETLQKIIANAKIDKAEPEHEKDNGELCFAIPEMEKLDPSGFNYHAVEQGSTKWKTLRVGKVTCSQIGNLIGLAGEKEQIHTLSCIKNKIDSSKVKSKKFRNFSRG